MRNTTMILGSDICPQNLTWRCIIASLQCCCRFSKVLMPRPAGASSPLDASGESAEVASEEKTAALEGLTDADGASADSAAAGNGDEGGPVQQ